MRYFFALFCWGLSFNIVLAEPDEEDVSGVFGLKLAIAAVERTKQTRLYDPRYVKLAYPMGDVPNDRGVCTDVVIRSYRALGVDLQVLVYEDMRRNFSLYPKRWGYRRPDRNIDHRRVDNLRVFFARQGQALEITDRAEDYKPGDIVSWNKNGGRKGYPYQAHMGVVTHWRSLDLKRPLISHNEGDGTELEDMLFAYPITGHFRFAAEPTVLPPSKKDLALR